jgi:hypothetical protein
LKRKKKWRKRKEKGNEKREGKGGEERNHFYDIP